MNQTKNIGIVGATGIVGKELINLLDEKKEFDLHNIKLYASERSKGKEIKINDSKTIVIKTIENIIDDNLDIIFLMSSSDISREIVKKHENKKTIIIDNSSEFRLNPKISLIVPEIMPEINVNKENITILANPNCCTVILCMLLYPLSKLSKLKQIDLCTYQSASGSGIEGLNELFLQNKEFGENKEILTKDYWKKQYIFNVFPHNSPINELNLMNDEENKIILETRKILDNNELLINPTCIRVPTIRSHCEAVTVYFEKEINKKEIEDIIKDQEGIELVEYCDTLTSSNKENVYVSRIRPNPILLNNEKNITKDKFNSWNFFISGDQLLKGAALNAYQIFKKVNKN